ncbi:M13 family metallopeptidase, partial [Klebsiella pneumoniae]|nr:M13 family metallopeptidase [Klebsiella pneumoniae]
VDSRDADKTYNKMTVAQLEQRAPGFDFSDLIAASGAQGVDSLLVAQPSAITGIAAQVRRAPIGVLKDQLLVRSLDAYAAYLPTKFD